MSELFAIVATFAGLPALAGLDAIVPLANLGQLADLADPTTLFGIFLNALSKFGVYVTIAAGLSLIFGLMGVLNFAHGSLTMIGAYLGGALMLTFVSSATSDLVTIVFFFLTLALVFALVTALGGVLEVGLIRPIYDRPPLFQILLTFGLVLVLEEGMRIVLEVRGIQPNVDWSAAEGTRPDVLGFHEILGVTTRGIYQFEAVVGILVVAATWWFLTRTSYGLHIRAGSEDAEMAQALGIDVRRSFTVVFGVGAGLAALAGVMLMWDPRYGASIGLGVETLLIAFVVVIVGGLGSFKGTVVAAAIVAVVDALASWMLVNDVVTFSGLPELVIFLVLVGVLVVRPQGLFGVEEVGGH
jgi:branched-chain amino acid transport system permease protein